MGFDEFDENSMLDYEIMEDMTMGNTIGSNMLNMLKYIPWYENEYLPQELDLSYGYRSNPRFTIEPRINQIIKIWTDDPFIECDALVIPITETWYPTSKISHLLMSGAGPLYLEDIYEFKKNNIKIETGNVMNLMHNYDLPCQHIIHTVPPILDERYPVASENAIHNCYWKCLELATDLNCRTICLPPIYPTNFFSEHLAIHILSSFYNFVFCPLFSALFFLCVFLCFCVFLSFCVCFF